jgi:hypothetical protein
MLSVNILIATMLSDIMLGVIFQYAGVVMLVSLCWCHYAGSIMLVTLC